MPFWRSSELVAGDELHRTGGLIVEVVQEVRVLDPGIGAAVLRELVVLGDFLAVEDVEHLYPQRQLLVGPFRPVVDRGIEGGGPRRPAAIAALPQYLVSAAVVAIEAVAGPA